MTCKRGRQWRPLLHVIIRWGSCPDKGFSEDQDKFLGAEGLGTEMLDTHFSEPLLDAWCQKSGNHNNGYPAVKLSGQLRTICPIHFRHPQINGQKIVLFHKQRGHSIRGRIHRFHVLARLFQNALQNFTELRIIIYN